MKEQTDSPGVAVFPPVLFLGTLGLGLFLQFVRPMHLLPPVLARVLGVCFLLASWLLVRAAEKAMKRKGTNIRPDRPSLAVVTDGPYRWTRNPMYLASTGLYLAVGLFLNTAWPLILLPFLLTLLEWGVIRREERYLDAKFGDTYRDYRTRVRRWV